MYYNNIGERGLVNKKLDIRRIIIAILGIIASIMCCFIVGYLVFHNTNIGWCIYLGFVLIGLSLLYFIFPLILVMLAIIKTAIPYFYHK